MRMHVILSVFKRNFFSYFSSVLGYLFIVVFVVGGAFLAFSPRFFTANEPNLDQLNEWFPTLLLFIIPAITMSVWADEKKQGTDELLFTLPATDAEILLGKYLSVLAVYSVALLFSLTHVRVLWYLGNPDLWQLSATYLGYFLAGAALLAAGMFASVLTGSSTVAFILGVMICAVPVYIGQFDGFVTGVGRVLSNPDGGPAFVQTILKGLGAVFGFVFGWAAEKTDFFEGLSISEQFRDFGMGVIPLSGVLYFVAFTLFMLYLNYIFITRRHWGGGTRSKMGMQFLVRAVAVASVLVSVCYLFGKVPLQIDMTSEGIHSLSDSTRATIKTVDPEHPITIQAFISKDVPREYVGAKRRLTSLLQQYNRLGGRRITVREVMVEPFSEAADEARHFGIEPVRIMTERDGRQSEEDVFLGAVVTSYFNETVIPFIGKGLPAEYELTRSIQVATKAERLKVGIVETDARLFRGSNEWRIVTELKKQYDVEEVSPARKIDIDKYDVLVAVMPSSLTDPEMKNLVEYVRLGRSVLIFEDPMPRLFGGEVAPRLPKPSPGGGMGMMGMGSPPAQQKHANGKLTDLLNELDVVWDNGRTVFDLDKPHPFFGYLPEEVVFLTSANTAAFNGDSPVTRGLEELVVIYSGTVQNKPASRFDYTPLLVTGGSSGLLEWDEYTSPGFNPFARSQTVQIKRSPFREIDKSAHALAAQIKSDKDGLERNVIFVADIDVIGDNFFEMRDRGDLPVEFDNVTFVLNAVDTLANEDSFIALRNRRAQHRTLTRVKLESERFITERMEEEKKADQAVKDALQDARSTFASRRKEIDDDATLDQNARALRLQQIQQVEQRKLEVLEANLENEKNARIRKAKVSSERQIRSIEGMFKWSAIVLPALLPILVGMLFLGIRKYGERSTVTTARKR
jgi:ABC-2 type transport system permease protein